MSGSGSAATAPLRDARGRGLYHMALAAFWFSVMSVLVKAAGRRIPAMEIVLVRAVVTLVLTCALLLRARVSPWGRRRALLVLRGLLGLGGLTCFYLALVHLPLADATVIQYSNPVFTAVLAAIFLRERSGWAVAACLTASLGGVLLIARPPILFGGAPSPVDPRWVAVALGGALFSAAAYVTVRELGRTEHPLVIVFFFPLVTAPAVLPVAAIQWVTPTTMEWLVLLGVGATTQVAQVHLARGLGMEPAGRAMTVGYLQIAFAAVWGVLFFAEIPDAATLGGALLIVGATFLLARWSRR